MSLNVVGFYKIRPKLPFRFKTEWYAGLLGDYEKHLSYCVTDVTLPKMGIENTNGFSFFGDVLMSNPTFSPGERKLEVSFEETDYMLVSKFLDKLVGRSFSRCPYFLTIVITQYDEHFQKEISKKGYVCHLSNYEEPSFKRDGQAQAVKISATFIVDSVIEHFTNDKIVQGQIRREVNGLNVNELVIDEENTSFKYGNLKIPTNGSSTNASSFRQANIRDLRTRMKNAGIDTTNLSQVTEYLRKHTDYYSGTSGGRCAEGVSLAVSIVEGRDEYASHGNGNTYGISGSKRTEMSASDIDKKAANLKNGESFVVSFKNLNDGAIGDTLAEQYGHVVIISRDSTGQLTYTSDFQQKGWRTYSNIDTLIQNGAKFEVMEL